ncbi:BlaI/MecI/CopY family transcriptional regulator [Streptomyces murinus]|uniref:BlaI/MecI/CopY family transcriptional regulator n=1 Tax=Streptomyces murinus TaxID=33900 RepID=UPI00382D40D4
MADEPAETTIQDKYAQQYADHIAANRREQGDITARLEQLKAEEAWLVRALDSLPAAPASSASEARAAAAESEAPQAKTAEATETSAPAGADAYAPHSVPQQRQDDAEQEEQARPAKETAVVKKTTPRKASKTAAKKTTAKTAKKPPAGETPAQPAAATKAPTDKTAAGEPSGPPLWKLALDILLKTPGQPCVAREVHDQLTQDHPDQATSVQAVRTSLETLVKKGLAEKSTQQRNAMYTAYADPETDAAPPADATAAGNTEQAPEAADEKVPVEI